MVDPSPGGLLERKTEGDPWQPGGAPGDIQYLWFKEWHPRNRTTNVGPGAGERTPQPKREYIRTRIEVRPNVPW